MTVDAVLKQPPHAEESNVCDEWGTFTVDDVVKGEVKGVGRRGVGGRRIHYVGGSCDGHEDRGTQRRVHVHRRAPPVRNWQPKLSAGISPNVWSMLRWGLVSPDRAEAARQTFAVVKSVALFDAGLNHLLNIGR